MRFALIWAIHVCLSMSLSGAAAPRPGSDAWLTNGGVFPERFAHASVRTNQFASLRAEVVGGTLQVKCELAENISEPRLVASADAVGHWPARDWRIFTMRRFGESWAAEIPVDSLHVPQIYFVAGREAGRPVTSLMRVVHPHQFGMETPSHLFWAFIEGFELDLDGWRMPNATEVRTDPDAKSGRASLVARVPVGQRSIVVETTRLRGWFLEENGATGIGVWLRAKSGTGLATFTLVANARSTNQAVSRRAETFRVSTRWAKAALLFDSFPRVRLSDIDLFVIEFAAAEGTELLIDDLHLIGRWRDDF